MAIQVTVTPQGAGNPQIFTTWFSNMWYINYLEYHADYYYVNANPAWGYRFAGLKWTRSKTTSGGTTTEDLHATVRSGSVYPRGSPTDHSHADFNFAHSTIYDTWGGTHVLSEEGDVVSVEVLYKRTYTPTHLLVNSATVGNPVQLVYDPATNLLVADY